MRARCSACTPRNSTGTDAVNRRTLRPRASRGRISYVLDGTEGLDIHPLSPNLVKLLQDPLSVVMPCPSYGRYRRVEGS
jgi:hypothetical protein